MKNKKGFIDPEIVGSVGFVILAVMAVSATILGWSMSAKMGFEAKLPIWQLLTIIGVELMACYIIVARG